MEPHSAREMDSIFLLKDYECTSQSLVFLGHPESEFCGALSYDKHYITTLFF
jgi:hypothetical protein